MSALSTTSNSIIQQTILQAKNAVNSMIQLINDNKILEASNYLLDDTYFIRPTGNPLTKANWLQMLSSPDVKVVSNKLVQWNFADVSPDNTWVYLCYTTHSVFNYMGTDTHGPKFVNMEKIKKIAKKVKSRRGQFDTELLIRLSRGGFKIAEAPIKHFETRKN